MSVGDETREPQANVDLFCFKATISCLVSIYSEN